MWCLGVWSLNFSPVIADYLGAGGDDEEIFN
jgi:hypothetical protein